MKVLPTHHVLTVKAWGIPEDLSLETFHTCEAAMVDRVTAHLFFHTSERRNSAYQCPLIKPFVKSSCSATSVNNGSPKQPLLAFSIAQVSIFASVSVV